MKELSFNQNSKTSLLSSSRLPLDHLLSGAVFAGAMVGGISVVSKKSNTKALAKAILQGGVASSFAISSANAVAKKEYLNAAIYAGLGFGGVALIETFFKNQNKDIK